ncbi:hypothetical protein MPNT_40199 [Candidatus Methylacidithermus pantelleriae]|uniref:Uncharacterized protein n=1 Tax=Candidatus Methylacidithermus pantelleriae TaxID=2744239 RepID=A0A8J2FTB7_9BACT|nr:hypothetical protein MPNT_40199 [Candidatus Methylacidithermus pantelleriae]
MCHPRKGVRVTDVRQTLASPLSLLHEVVAQKRRFLPLPAEFRPFGWHLHHLDGSKRLENPLLGVGKSARTQRSWH